MSYGIFSNIHLSPLANKKYDFIFSIGSFCNCAFTLNNNLLRYKSSPFDWVFGASFTERFSILLNGFADFFNKEDLEYTVEPVPCYRNNLNKIHFNHDFLETDTLLTDEIYLPVKEKYDRRISRLLKILNTKSCNVLCVYIETSSPISPPPPPPPSQSSASLESEIMSLCSMAKEKFKANLDILYVMHENSLDLNQLFLEALSQNVFVAKLNNISTAEYWMFGNHAMLSSLFGVIHSKQADVLEKYSRSDKLFIYGAGAQANFVARNLIHRGIKFSGFVISSTQEKPKTLFKFGKKVFYPNELPYPHSEIAVYYGLSPENAKYVREYLKDNRIVFGCEFLENAVSFS